MSEESLSDRLEKLERKFSDIEKEQIQAKNDRDHSQRQLTEIRHIVDKIFDLLQGDLKEIGTIQKVRDLEKVNLSQQKEIDDLKEEVKTLRDVKIQGKALQWGFGIIWPIIVWLAMKAFGLK